MNNSLAEKRIGERREMNVGGWATLTEYTDANDITIQFDSGETVCHKKYYAFVRGEIRSAGILQKSKEQYIGTEYDTKHYGKARIVEYNGSSDITVMFLDTGETAQHRSLANIRKGDIRPDSKRKEESKIRKGQTYVNAQGIWFSVIDISTQNGRDKYTLQFEDGTVLENVSERTVMCTYSNKNLHPLLPHSGKGCGSKAKQPVRIGNMDLTGTAYVCSNEYNFFCHCPFCGTTDVLTAAEARAHTCPESIGQANAKQPIFTGKPQSTAQENIQGMGKKQWEEQREERIGTRVVQTRSGLTAECIEYKNAGKITVRFDDGIEKKTTWHSFSQGLVSHPASAPKNKRLGERKQMNCGEWATLISYNSYRDVSVRFDSGEIISHRAYGSFVKGEIRPSFSSQWIGQKKVMNCGIEAEIISYSDYSHIDVRLADGSIIQNCTTTQFTKGTIKRPDDTSGTARINQCREKLLGTQYETRNYGKIQITEYINSNDVTVLFLETGEIARHKTMGNIRKGDIRPEKIDKKEQNAK